MISTLEKVLFLKSIDLFSQIPGDDLAKVAEITTEITFNKNEVVFQEGDVGDSLYLTIEGSVRIHIGSREIAVITERECFGDMAILDNEPRSASVTALENVLLLKIEREDFYALMSEKDEIAQGVIKVLSKRLRTQISSE